MINREEALRQAILHCAEDMCAAAQSAPKACGLDSVMTAILTGDDLGALCAEMERIEDTVPNCIPIFKRDAKLVSACPAVVLIGTIRHLRGLVPCGLCGNANCAVTAKTDGHCCFDDMDLGIAIGSAAVTAADHRVDNRVLYTAGYAATRMKLLGENVSTIIAIPLNIEPRNPFFVRPGVTAAAK